MFCLSFCRVNRIGKRRKELSGEAAAEQHKAGCVIQALPAALLRSRCLITGVFPAGFHISFCDFSLPFPTLFFFFFLPSYNSLLFAGGKEFGLTRVALSNILNLNGNSVNNKCSLSLSSPGEGLGNTVQRLKKKPTRAQSSEPAREWPQPSGRGQLQIIKCPFVAAEMV